MLPASGDGLSPLVFHIAVTFADCLRLRTTYQQTACCIQRLPQTSKARQFFHQTECFAMRPFPSACQFVPLLLLIASTSLADEVTLIGRVEIPATATDLSGQTDSQENGTPQNRLGGHGSGIAWTGRGNQYVMLPDRGPDDGSTSYRCRFHLVEIAVTDKPQGLVTARLLETHLLVASTGEAFVGRASQFDRSHPELSLRLDPEGVCATKKGTLLISDEYGPSIREFDFRGKWLRDVSTPAHYLIASPGETPQLELPPHNTSGRQNNRGWEGIAISDDDQFVYAITQSPLMQDGGLNETNARVGTNIRIWEYNQKNGASRELLYPLDNKSLGCSDILFLAPNKLLTIERDSQPGDAAKVKRLYEIDLAGATDISGIQRLPISGIPDGVRPVSKRLYLDLLDPDHGLAGKEFPEKIEGIALGPQLNDGSRVLIVASDNDFKGDQPTVIYAFRVRH